MSALIKEGADPQLVLAALMIRHLDLKDTINFLHQCGGAFDFKNKEIQQSLIILINNNNFQRIEQIKKIAGEAFDLSDPIYTVYL